MLFGFKIVRQPRKVETPELEKKIIDLELEVSKLKSHMNSLRGFVNRKMDYPDGDEDPKKKPTPIDDGLDSLRQ